MDKKIKRFTPPIILVLGLLIFLMFVGYYFFYWIPEQKACLTNRYLRVMAMMSDQFEKRGENFPKEIEIPIDNQNPVVENNSTKRKPIIEGIKKYLQGNLKSYFPDTVLEPYLSPTETQYPQEFYNSFQDAFIFQVEVKSFIPGVPVESLMVNIPVKGVDFIRELSCGEEFDDVLIFDEQARVIYMRNQYMKKGIENSIRALNIKEISNERGPQPGSDKDQKEAKAGNVPGYTRLLDLKIAGSDYKFFLQPIPLRFLQSKFGPGSATPWQIAGLLSADTFSRRCREIPIFFLLLLSFLLLLAFIAYPLVKILLIGPWERIRIRDVCFLALSLAIGVPLIIFSILTISHHQATYVNLEKDFKKLADDIDERFTNEIMEACDQLSFIDNNKEEFSLFNQDKAKKKKSKQNSLDSLLKKFGGITYPYFDMVFILDSNGNQCYKGVADDSTISFKNVSTRDYFRRVINKDYWYTNKNQPMVLDPVYSMDTVRYELNLAIPSTDSTYAAAVMSFRPLSVLNPLIPGDYGFAVIDRDGKVIFHKDRRLNLNENFFSECSDAKRIKSAIFSKAHDFISSSLYQGKKRDIFIKPMTKIPWTIIVFRDQGINASRNLEKLFRAIFLYIVYLMALTALLLCYIVFIFAHNRSSKTQRRPHTQKAGWWIWPNKELRSKYTCLAFFNFLCFFLLIVSLFTSETPYRQFLLIPVINLLLAYLVIRKESLNNERKEKEKKEEEKKEAGKFKPFIVPLVLLAAVLILSLITKSPGISLAVKILITLLFIAIFFALVYGLGKVEKIKNHLNYRNSHVLLVYSFVLLFFAHPPLMSDKISQDNDMIVDVKYHQLKLANDYSNWTKNIELDYKSQEQVITSNLGPGAGGVFAGMRGIYSIKFYQTSIISDRIFQLRLKNKPIVDFTIKTNTSTPTPTTNSKSNYIEVNTAKNPFTIQVDLDKTTQKKEITVGDESQITNAEAIQIENFKYSAPLINSTILKQISDIIPFDNSYSEAVRYLYMDPSKEQKKNLQDYPLEWGYFKSKSGGNEEDKEVIFLKYLDKPNLEYNEARKKVEPVYVISRPQWRMNREAKLWLWGGFLVAVLFIFLLFYIVRFTWKVIFLESLEISPEETAYIRNTVDEIKKLKGRFFIYGNVPETINALGKNKDCLVIDCWKDEKVKSIRENFPTDKKYIVITHFDYMSHNPQVNREKLALLEQVPFGCNTTIIVYSQFEPLENFNLSGGSVKHEEDKQETGNGPNYPTVIESWQRVLRQFEFKYALDEGSPGDPPAEPQIPKGLTESSASFIDNECSALGYIKPLKTPIFPDIEKMTDKNIGDHGIRDIIYKHAKPKYDFIWRTSTKEEKLVMLQLAHEGLLNFKNRKIIRQLLKRKLIGLSPLRLFNTTFKDYLGSVEDRDSILKWEETKADSKWANVRKPLLFLLTVIIVFLVISQPNVLSTWLALIPAITGVITLLPRLFDQLLGFGVKT